MTSLALEPFCQDVVRQQQGRVTAGSEGTGGAAHQGGDDSGRGQSQVPPGSGPSGREGRRGPLVTAVRLLRAGSGNSQQAQSSAGAETNRKWGLEGPRAQGGLEGNLPLLQSPSGTRHRERLGPARRRPQEQGGSSR